MYDDETMLTKGGAILIAFIFAAVAALNKISRVEGDRVLRHMGFFVFMLGCYNCFKLLLNEKFNWYVAVFMVICFSAASMFAKDNQ